ncbi:transposase [Desulfovibrio inopinatus]|uniref:transposase n=1 Tax=Desulfovibrio inopinatus TaxID=102109 RepID=UPI00042668A9|nr:transposase [Desulfovibrio inopinatus]
MPRSARFILDDRPAVYHVMSRTALDGYPFGDVEKDYFLALLKRLARVYFCEILGFAIMGNHFHLLVRMTPAASVSEENVCERFKRCYGDTIPFSNARCAELQHKWTSLSEFVGELKQTFSRFYNKRHRRRGTLWGERYKSVLVEDGRTLVHCLAYIDLNPVRAGLVRRPEDYRWSSIGYHLQTNNRDTLLSLDYGLVDWNFDDSTERQRHYRQYLYEVGECSSDTDASIDPEIAERARQADYTYTLHDRLRLRTRWFTDAGIIGSKSFVSRIARELGLPGADTRMPKHVSGLEIYSLRRLSEKLFS